MEVAGVVVGQISAGLLVLAGFVETDTAETADRLAEKIVKLRIFEDEHGRMNRSVLDISGAVLCVSQFTLHADVRRGNRPSFDAAAPGPLAEPLYRAFCEALRRHGVACETGTFGAEMQVRLTNHGPVTVILDSADLERPRRA